MYGKAAVKFKKVILCILIFDLVLCPSITIAKPVYSGLYGVRSRYGKSVSANALPQLRNPAMDVQGVSAFDYSSDASRLDIRQTEKNVVIDWASFDIGAGAETCFDQQGNANWSALNRIWDHSPSLIFGKLKADGRIFLINQNGVLFGDGSQVNLNTLMATSMNMDDDEFRSGGWKKGSISLNSENYTGQEDWNELKAEIVNEGNIQADTGGAVFLAGPNVINSGTIDAPAGQVGLVAGTGVNLGYRGEREINRDVYITGTPGSALNEASGRLTADMGMAGMYGRVVNQEGLIRSVTAIQKNGEIQLFATERVTTGANSRTECPISDDPERLHQSTTVNPGLIDIGGVKSSINDSLNLPETIEHSGLIKAPGGIVKIRANEEILIKSGSTIDVAGLWADRSASDNQVDVQLNSQELADFFRVREGSLRGETVFVNALKGSSVGNISTHLNDREFNAKERFTSGGSIILDANEGTVNVEKGASIDFSGGGYHYAAGSVKTSKVRYGNRIYDISDIPEEILENGEKLTLIGEDEARRLRINSITKINAYDEGSDAGSFTLFAKKASVKGSMDGSAARGIYQTMADEPSITIGGFEYQTARGRKEPAGGSFNIGERGLVGFDYNFTLNDLVIVKDAAAIAADPGENNYLASDILNSAGLGYLNMNAKKIIIDKNAKIKLQPSFKGSIYASAAGIEHYGTINAPGKDVTFETYDALGVPAGSSRILLAKGSSIITAGEQKNNSFFGGRPVLLPVNHLNGGSVILNARAGNDDSAELEAGSLIDVSGGYAVGQDGRTITGGDAGSLSVTAPSIILDGDIKGHSLIGKKGGKLALHAGNIIFSGAMPEDDYLLNLEDQHMAKINQSGFTDIAYKSVNGMVFPRNIILEPSRKKYMLLLPGRIKRQTVSQIEKKYFEPDTPYLNPSYITIKAGQLIGGAVGDILTSNTDIKILQGSKIRVSPGGGITLAGGNLDIAGELTALAGDVTLSAGTDKDIILQNSARINAKGYNRQLLNKTAYSGLPQFKPEDGGKVILNAHRGALQMKNGAQVDVSGAPKVTNRYFDSMGRLFSRNMAGNAGEVELSGESFDISGGSFNASTAMPGQQGGSISMLFLDKENPLSLDQDILQKFTGSGFDSLTFRSLAGIEFFGGITENAGRIGRELILDTPVISASGGSDVYLSAPWIQLENRFDKYLEAEGSNNQLSDFFAGWDEISRPLDNSSLTFAGGWLDITGSCAVSGFNNLNMFFEHDIRLQDHPAFRDRLTKIFKDWRGGFKTLADLTLKADRIYPATDAAFTFSTGYVESIEVEDPEGNIQERDLWHGGDIMVSGSSGAASDNPIFSAGGSLTLHGHHINVYGTLAAPVGYIRLEGLGSLLPGQDGPVEDNSRVLQADGSLLTTAGKEAVMYGNYEEDLDWTLTDKSEDAGQYGIEVTNVPERGVSVTAIDIIEENGSVTDVSGGGLIYSYRFFPSIMGSADPLKKSGRFVIIPDNSIRLPGRGIYLQKGPGIAEGLYSILPEEYAFVPGALILEDIGEVNPADNLSVSMAGYPVVTGRTAYMGSSIFSSQEHNYAIRSAADVLGEGLFAGEYLVAGDAGEFRAMGRKTDLSGTLKGNGLSGYAGASAHLSGKHIVVGNTVPDIEDLLFIRPEAFLSSGFEQIEFGIINEDSTDLTDPYKEAFALLKEKSDEQANETETITFQEGIAMECKVIGIYAKDIEFNENTSFTADEILIKTDMEGDVAMAETAAFKADSFGIFSGGLDAQNHPDVENLLVFGTDNPIAMVPDEFNGDPAGLENPFMITENLWSGFNQTDVVAISSSGGINTFGDIAAGAAESLILKSPKISVFEYNGRQLADFNAKAVYLEGMIPKGDLPMPESDNGTLNIRADDTFFIGAGNTGFDGADIFLESGGDIIFGRGSMDTGGNLTMTADRITSNYETDFDGNYLVGSYSVNAGDRKVTIMPGGTALEIIYAPGGSLDITADTIEHFGLIDLYSDRVNLTATGGGPASESGSGSGSGIFLRDGSRILAQGGAVGYDIAGKNIIDVIRGGSVGLNSLNGALEVSETAVVDVSVSAGTDLIAGADHALRDEWIAAGRLDAGDIIISAPAQAAVLDGTFLGKSEWGRGGVMVLDTLAFDLTAQNNRLAHGGFTRGAFFRARTGDLSLDAGETLTAEQIKVAADSGKIDVWGTMDASGRHTKRRIELFAGNDVHLHDGSLLDARGTENGAYGGDVSVSSASGWVNMDAQAAIDVFGGANARGGSVVFRASRFANTEGEDNDVQVNLSGVITGASDVVVAAVKRYDTDRLHADGLITYADRINTSFQSDIRSWTSSYMSSSETKAASVKQNLETANTDFANTTAFHFIPEVEIYRDGDLRLYNDWDLSSDSSSGSSFGWRYGENEEPGILTICAAGDLMINSSITDNAQNELELRFEPEKNDTWKIVLVAGADLTASNPAAVTKGTGDLTIDDGEQVYTESGDLVLAAGRDINIEKGVKTGDDSSMSFSAGTFDGDIMVNAGRDLVIDGDRIRSSGSRPGGIQSALGNIDLSIGRDLDISQSGTAIRTTGKPWAFTGAKLSADPDLSWMVDPLYGWNEEWGDSWEIWGPLYESDSWFQMSFDTILHMVKGYYWKFDSGGSIAMDVGGSVFGSTDSGEWMGLYTNDKDPEKFGPRYKFTSKEAPVSGIATLAGGNINIETGGDFLACTGAFGPGDVSIYSGGNMDGRFMITGEPQGTAGQGNLSAMGSFGTLKLSSLNMDQQIIEMANANVNLRAQGDLVLGSICNPAMAHPDLYSGAYLGYSEDKSAAHLFAARGDVILTGKSYFHQGYAEDSIIDSFRKLLPPKMEIFSGRDIILDSMFTLAPSSTGGLKMAAKGSITRGNNMVKSGFLISDMAPETIYAHYLRPDGYSRNLNRYIDFKSHGFSKYYKEKFDDMWQDLDDEGKDAFQNIYDKMQRNLLLHKDDRQPVEVLAGMDITNLTLTSPKSSEIYAGGDINNLCFRGQNTDASDITSILTGGSLFLDIPEGLGKRNTGLELGGPGWFLVNAAGAIDLGATMGITTIGPGANKQLDKSGASLAVASGYAPNVFINSDDGSFFPSKVETFFDELRKAGSAYSALKRGEMLDEYGMLKPVDINWARGLGDRYRELLTGYSHYDDVEEEIKNELAKSMVENTRTELINPYLLPVENSPAADNGLAKTALNIGIDFEENVASGTVSMVQSKIRTEKGGGIYMLASGDIDVGGSAFGSAETDSGINCQLDGPINIFAKNDINVNESRVMTWYGGNIIMWADFGNINAGKGSKTTVSLASKDVYYDDDLERWLPLNSPPAVGSGIRLMTHDPDGIFGPRKKAAPGTGYLFAPDGEIDAGEAGIKGMGNLIFEAQRLINVQNIETAGVSVGVSTQQGDVGALGSMTGVSTLTEASNISGESTLMASNRERFEKQLTELSESLLPKWLAVKVIGFGEEDEEEKEKEEN